MHCIYYAFTVAYPLTDLAYLIGQYIISSCSVYSNVTCRSCNKSCGSGQYLSGVSCDGTTNTDVVSSNCRTCLNNCSSGFYLSNRCLGNETGINRCVRCSEDVVAAKCRSFLLNSFWFFKTLLLFMREPLVYDLILFLFVQGRPVLWWMWRVSRYSVSGHSSVPKWAVQVWEDILVSRHMCCVQ